ncbi:ABC transporter ATP-binding protein [Paenibacillus sp. TH7-28]
MNHIVDISNLTKNYSSFKLDNINLQIPYGRIVGLIGENGAGKTTLISLILNQIKRDSGSIKIFDEDNIKEENKIKQKIGFLIDECCFHSCLNAKDIRKIMRSIYTQWNDAEFNSLLIQLNVDSSKKISELSKGMKNKLMLAVAMSHNPSLLILDEVTSGLDPVVRDEILLLLKGYVQQRQTTVFFSTHITSDLDKIADDIAFIHNGKLIFYEPLQKLQEDYIFLKCSKDEYQRINPKDIFITSCRENEYSLLIKSDSKYSDNIGCISTPTIDDIMLLYIKGDLIHDRVN